MGDDLVVAVGARGIATRLAEDLGRVTVVTAGVHDDNIDAGEIVVFPASG